VCVFVWEVVVRTCVCAQTDMIIFPMPKQLAHLDLRSRSFKKNKFWYQLGNNLNAITSQIVTV
jgi:hypothetical protein